ncbi:helix-turn-helix transcriptional regulator [Pseudanabaena sp. 'Roaring Creek']|uniref:helix-turn-helix domain-containing protein n=1 Tax=Pseudanabaena sp. 'Roaring Creek' TaxID=1681830 RepID=UPI00092EE6E4
MYCRLAVLMMEKDTRLSQRELSRRTGLSVTAINRLHNNEFDRVDAATINTLCNYFNCEVGDLFVMKEVEEIT